MLRHKWKEAQAQSVLSASQAAAARSKRMAKLCSVFQLESSSSAAYSGKAWSAEGQSGMPSASTGGHGDKVAGQEAVGRDWGTADVAAVVGLAELLDEDWVEQHASTTPTDSNESILAWDRADRGRKGTHGAAGRGSVSMAELSSTFSGTHPARSIGFDHLPPLHIPRHFGTAAASRSPGGATSPATSRPWVPPSPSESALFSTSGRVMPVQPSISRKHARLVSPSMTRSLSVNNLSVEVPSTPPARRPQRPGAAAWKCCVRAFTALHERTQRHDDESYLCYAAYVLVAICDFSLLAMVFPVSMVAYALLAQHKARNYWQVCCGQGLLCTIEIQHCMSSKVSRQTGCRCLQAYLFFACKPACM